MRTIVPWSQGGCDLPIGIVHLTVRAIVIVSRLALQLLWEPKWREFMKLNVTLDRDEDGVWVVECPSIPGCVSQGQTREEALENIKDAMTACLQVRAERDKYVKQSFN
jgi:predicted RNase H-like HicB family nuclease